MDSLKNGDKILLIGSNKTIRYHYETAAELLANYFNIIDESNLQILNLIDRYKIQSAQYFPIFGFDKINKNIQSTQKLETQQIKNIEDGINNIPSNCKKTHNSIEEIEEDESIPASYKMNSIMWNTHNGNISLNIVEDYLRKHTSTSKTEYRKLLSVYDLKKYKD